MNYDEFKVEDFLFDEFFVRWVNNPGPESNHFWENWIKGHPDKITVINQASEIIRSIQFKNRYVPTDQDYTVVLEKVLNQQTSWSQDLQHNGEKTFSLWVRYAAAILILAVFAAIFLYVGHASFQEAFSPVSTIIKETPFGQKLTFELADGTVVKLNAGSTLKYPDKFEDRERKVFLEGEAFFNVKRDESRPFIVETVQLTTTVLGTSFNVEAYGNDNSTVAVQSGKVQVRKANSEMDSDTFFLTSNQMLTISSETNSIYKFDGIPDDLFAWKDNIISFSKADFKQITHRLEKWYGVDFKIQKQGQFEGLFTGRYQDEPLDIVLEGLKDEYNFHFTINDKVVLIY